MVQNAPGIRKVLENTAIRNDWIHCFDNLFMEVL